MPSIIQKNAKTTWVDERPWSSPDGKVTIWNIKLEIDGVRGDISTMSKIIAQVGWTGDVEIYTNDKGKEYVRQAPKEEFAGSPSAAGGPDWESRQNTITAEWAIGQAKDWCLAKGLRFDDIEDYAENFKNILGRIEAYRSNSADKSREESSDPAPRSWFDNSGQDEDRPPITDDDNKG